MFQHPMLRESLFKIWCYLLGSMVLITGLFYLMLGFTQTDHGQMWYLLLLAILMSSSAHNICRKKSKGVWLYLLLFVLSLLWAYWHIQLHLWLFDFKLIWLAILCAAILLTLPAIRKYQYQVPRFKGVAYAGAALIALVLIPALHFNFSHGLS